MVIPVPQFFPKVSIVIPVYNGSNYLREAIDSALAQTYKDIEVIVVNDGSKDGGKTETISLSYGERIRYFAKENEGVSSALNYGIRKMTGEYFSWLSHDDVYYPQKIEVQLDYLRNKNENTILYSDYDVIDCNSKYIKKTPVKNVESDRFRYALLFGSPIHGCSVLVPKACFDRCGFFDDTFLTMQDLDMWFRMAKWYTFKYIPQKLIMSRSHDEQGSKQKTDTVSLERDNFYLHCLKNMSIEELLDLSKEKSVSLLFLTLAFDWRKRKARNSSNYALELSHKFLHKERVLVRLKCRLLSLCCRSYDLVNYSKYHLKNTNLGRRIIVLVRQLNPS
jgi:glycosyltransferase involved in cell wall biosynthesis